MLAIEVEVAGELLRRGGDLHLPVVDMQDLRGLVDLPRLAILDHHAQEDVVVLSRLQIDVKQAGLEARGQGKDLVANNVALVEQRA